MKKSNYILLGIIVVIIGISLSIGGIIYKINYNNKYKDYSKEISAKVINSVVKSENKKDKATGLTSSYYVYAPVIEYKINNKEYRYESKIYSITKPKINSKINIRVNDRNPKKIKSIDKDYTTIILISGIVIMVCGLSIIIIKSKKHKKKNNIDKKDTIENDEREILEVLEDEIKEDII